MKDLVKLSIAEARKGLDQGDFTSEELTRATFERIARLDSLLNTHITLAGERAFEQARLADKKIRKGEGAPLTGIPVGFKDLILTRDMRTTCASRMLEHFVSPYDATVAVKLFAQGAVLCGKHNMDEFAMGSSSETSFFGPVKNPWDVSRIAGGSSGGSAAAVATGFCMAALGSDTGGSIRQPASHCGVVGLKPSYGRVSRYGAVAYASSLDQIGPLTRNVEDSAIMLSALAGHDPKDSTSANIPVPDYRSFLSRDLNGLTIGLPVEYHEAEGVDPEVKKAINEAVRVLEACGAKVVQVRLPHAPLAVAVYYIVSPSEASTNLARFDGVHYGFRAENFTDLLDLYEKSRSEGFGEEVKRRILIGTYALSSGYYDAYYVKALKVRSLIASDLEGAFRTCDILAAPVAPTPALPLNFAEDDPLTRYLADAFTLVANLAGTPGISVPCGFSKGGLPIGLQLIGKAFDEGTLLKTAYAYEKEAALNIPLAEPGGKKL